MTDNVRTLVRLAEELGRANAASPGEQVSKGRAEPSLRDARERLTTVQDALAGRTRDAELYVRAKPWRSIALAGGAGVLVGLLMGRR